jgi:hypothetical protein
MIEPQKLCKQREKYLDSTNDNDDEYNIYGIDRGDIALPEMLRRKLTLSNSTLIKPKYYLI